MAVLDMFIEHGSALARDTLRDVMGLAMDTQQHILPWAKLGLAFSSFATAATGICAITNTLFGLSAHQHLATQSIEIARHMASISAEVEGMNQAAQANLNLNHQLYFAKHVYDLVDMHSDRMASLGPQCMLVYHPGTDWHAAFHQLDKEKPLKGLCGVTNKMDLFRAWLPPLREVVGPDVHFNILLPTIHPYVIPDELVFDPAVGHLTFIGSEHRSGEPYVYITASENSSATISYQSVGVLKPLLTIDPPKAEHRWVYRALQALIWTILCGAALVIESWLGGHHIRAFVTAFISASILPITYFLGD